MQPRWHFVLRAALMIFGLLLFTLIAIYLFSFVLFTLHKSGLWFAPQFGQQGFMLLVMGSPWLLLSILGIFILLLYILVSQYSFSYRKPLVYSMIAVVFLVIATASVIQYFGVHDRMQTFVEQRGTPGLAPLYKNHEEKRPTGIIRGTIAEVTGSGFLITTDRDEELSVSVTQKTKTPPRIQLTVGTEILVFGDREGDIISAFGIKPATQNLPSRSGPSKKLPI